MSNPTVVTNSKTRINFRTYEQYRADPDPAKNELQCVASDAIVERGDPSADTHYIKFSSGLVLQYGFYMAASTTQVTITLPVAMANADFTTLATFATNTTGTTNYYSWEYWAGRTTTTISIKCYAELPMNWLVIGRAAD